MHTKELAIHSSRQRQAVKCLLHRIMKTFPIFVQAWKYEFDTVRTEIIYILV